MKAKDVIFLVRDIVRSVPGAKETYYRMLNWRYRGIKDEDLPQEIQSWYKRRTGVTLNLDNPQTFNEKIQWLKIYDNSQLRTDLADKYRVRRWVAEKIGEQYLIPLLGVWKNADEIDFDKLPEQFVLKTNHGCGFNIIVKEKSQANIKKIRKRLNGWLGINYALCSGFEMQYKNIQPLIIAEAYLENLSGELNDYKVFCFHGEAKYILYTAERATGLKLAFYNREWSLMPFVYRGFERIKEATPKPKNLSLLLALAETLSEGFMHVRVDFYCMDDGSLKFGECTFSSTNGTDGWDPPEWGKILGDMIHLPTAADIDAHYS